MRKTFAHTYLDLFLTLHQDIYLNDAEYITDRRERFVLYEAYRRHILKLESINLLWVQNTLGVTFPTAKKIRDKLVKLGYLDTKICSKDKRNKLLSPSEKLVRGIEIFESFKKSFISKYIKENKDFGKLDQSALELLTKKIISLRK
ncbi:MAG: hypothetical protein VW146_00355 [Gammaproteobacteria bacterium]